MTQACQRYDFKEREWQDIAKLKEGRIHFGLAQTDHGLLAIGGYNGENAISTYEFYDPKLNSWKIYGSLNQPKMCFGWFS